MFETANTTGEALSSIIQDVLIRHGLPLDNLHGQCYDGATNMAGDQKGVQSRILNTGVAVKSIIMFTALPTVSICLCRNQSDVSLFSQMHCNLYIHDLAIVTKQDRLNHLTVLHVHQDKLDAVNLNKFKVDFASANEYRRTVFGHR